MYMFNKNVHNFQYTYLFQQEFYRSLFHTKQGMQLSQQIGHMTRYVLYETDTKKAIIKTIRKLSNKGNTVLSEEIRFL